MAEALPQSGAKATSESTRSSFLANVPKGMKVAFKWALGLTVALVAVHLASGVVEGLAVEPGA